MQVKFLTKKQREQLKKAKQSLNNDQATQNNTPAVQQKSIKTSMDQQKNNHLHFQRSPSKQKSQSGSQGERSRQKRRIVVKDVTDEQKKQRDNFKRKYLGLEKPELNKRFENNYKGQLLFQWKKTDDTSGGILDSFGREALRSIQKKFTNKSDQNLQKKWNEKSFEEMTDRDWRIFREDNQIYIKGGRVCNPFREWHQNPDLAPQLLQNLKRLRFQKPKPIQMQAIPIGFQSKDMVAIAPTGQGKTLGFLIPVLNHVSKLPRVTIHNQNQGPHAIILVPSRELAEQIQDQFIKIKYGGITAVRVVGGVQLDMQANQVNKGHDIIIGTPGRIKQLIQKHYLLLKRCSWVVVDEADKMISQNLIEDIEWILDCMGGDSAFSKDVHGKQRVTHMFSATMVPEIQKLTKKYLIAPAFVTIGQIGGGKKDIEQHVFMLNQANKNEQLGKILRNLPAPIIVFVNSRAKCQKIINLIQNKFHRSCQDYHGGKSQDSRQSIIQNFRNGKFQVLVATDLGGRGLDIKGISAAISYDAPKNISQFIHRAGRSGRAGVKGKAFTFLTNQDEPIFYDVKTFLQRNQFKVPEQLRDHPAAQMKPGTFAHVRRSKQIVYTN